MKNNYQTLRLEVTGKCPLECVYCHASKIAREEFAEEELTTLRKIKIIEEASELGFKEVTLTGGEFFKNPDWWKLVEACHKVKLNVNMTTSGMLFTEHRLKKMDQYKNILKEIRISLDGLEVNNLIRKGSSYKIILSRLGELVIRYPSTKVCVQTCCYAQNLPELVDLYRRLINIGIKRWRLDVAWETERSKKFADILTLVKIPDLYQVFAEILKLYFSNQPPMDLVMLNAYDSRFTMSEEDVNKYVDIAADTHPCAYTFPQVNVKANGKLFHCPPMNEKDYADVKNQSLADVLGSPNNHQRWYQDFIKIKMEDLICFQKLCRYRRICGGGCRYEAYLQSGGWEAVDKRACESMMCLEKYILPVIPQNQKLLYNKLIERNDTYPL